MNTNLCNESQDAGGAGRRKAGAAQRLMLEGKFHVEHWRDGKLIGVHDIDNAITVAAKNLLLEVMFRNGTKITSWFIGLVSNDTPTPPSDIPETDTYASHADFAEFTGYDEAGRQQWSPGAAANKSVTNSGSPLDLHHFHGRGEQGHLRPDGRWRRLGGLHQGRHGRRRTALVRCQVHQHRHGQRHGRVEGDVHGQFVRAHSLAGDRTEAPSFARSRFRSLRCGYGFAAD